MTNFLEGKLQAFYKSEPLPETVSFLCIGAVIDVWTILVWIITAIALLQNEDDVKVVVANSFDDIVLDESKDVLLEVLNQLRA